jgi:DNA primase
VSDFGALGSVTIEEFLDSEGIEYRRTSGNRGPQFNIQICPACGGGGYKVYFGEDTGFGNCFHGSCGKSFNIWTFAKAFIGTESASIIHKRFEEIAKRSGWKPQFKKKREVVPVFEGDIKLPVSFSLGGPSARNVAYLEDRGVTPGLAEAFDLRMCQDGAFAYKTEDGQDKKMVFSGRILIPIRDLAGNMVTFQGRDCTGENDPKYLFPPRLPATGRFIYNGHRALVEGWSHLVMGEGAFDVIGIQAALETDRGMVGIGSVGSFGKNLSLDSGVGVQSQLQELITLKAAGAHTITILWDGTADALAAALKTARTLSRYGFNVRVGFLPKGKDPAEVSSNTVLKAVAAAIPYSRALEIRVRLRNPYRD